MDNDRQQPVRVRGIGVKLDKGRDSAHPPIAELLRESIRLGLLKPGKPLIQASIAEAMGASRIPVREALHALAAEGLVTFGKDGGAYVTALAPDDIKELWALRSLLESHMALAVLRTATPADVAGLREMVEEMNELTSTAWSDHNFAFHLELNRLSGMPHAAACAGRVLTMIEPYLRVGVTMLQVEGKSNAEHLKIVDALAAGDGDELTRLLVQHSEQTGADLLAYATTMAQPVDQKAIVTEAARSLADHLNA